MAGSAEVIRNLYKWAELKKAGCEAVSRVSASEIEAYGKNTARWQNRTGNARNMLHAGFLWESLDILKLYFAHGMEYGVFLELANDGKYAILEESIKKFQDTWFKNIERVMNK